MIDIKMCRHCGIALADCEYHGLRAPDVKRAIDEQIVRALSPFMLPLSNAELNYINLAEWGYHTKRNDGETERAYAERCRVTLEAGA